MPTAPSTENVTTHLTALIATWEERAGHAYDDMDPRTGIAIDECLADLRSTMAELLGQGTPATAPALVPAPISVAA